MTQLRLPEKPLQLYYGSLHVLGSFLNQPRPREYPYSWGCMAPYDSGFSGPTSLGRGLRLHDFYASFRFLVASSASLQLPAGLLSDPINPKP